MELDRMLKALGEPTRLKIFQALTRRKHCVRSLARTLGISESAVSQHLKVMKAAGLVSGEKHGYHTHYLPLGDALDFLTEQLEQLRTAAAAAADRTQPCQCEHRTEGTRREYPA